MQYKLFKIVVDDHGIMGDGSDAKTHSELVYTGDEARLRQKMLSSGIFKNEFFMTHVPESLLSHFCSQKGYALQKWKEE